MSEAIWTVRRLIAKLQQLPPDLLIVGIYDYAFARDARKKHKWVETVTVNDVVAIKTDGSRKKNAVVIETTGVIDLSPAIPFKKKKTATA